MDLYKNERLITECLGDYVLRVEHFFEKENVMSYEMKKAVYSTWGFRNKLPFELLWVSRIRQHL